LKHRKRSPGSKIAIKNRVSIEERPETVNTKERFGDWEIDTVVGENNKENEILFYESLLLPGKGTD
jgi:IS30 family transposase